jgi:mono/diheme cytochrome c family protein
VPRLRPRRHDPVGQFFFLSVSPEGTVIEVRGTDEVENRFGGNCASCHSAADPQFDFVCEDDHGCAPLPIGDDIITAVQEADPRPLTRAP